MSNNLVNMENVTTMDIVALGLSFFTPKQDPFRCPCPDCQAGRPSKRLHWKLYPPKPVIINDEAILRLTYDSES